MWYILSLTRVRGGTQEAKITGPFSLAEALDEKWKLVNPEDPHDAIILSVKNMQQIAPVFVAMRKDTP